MISFKNRKQITMNNYEKPSLNLEEKSRNRLFYNYKFQSFIEKEFENFKIVK